MTTISDLQEALVVESDSGCWEWQGDLTRGGYATGWVHRSVYRQFVGPIEQGLQIDHTCFNRRCINPAHLEAVSAKENMRRAADRAWGEACKRGHLRTDANTYVSPEGHRQCRACRTDATYRWRDRNPQGAARHSLSSYYRRKAVRA